MDDAFGHWLAGFIDGEGCFTARVSRQGQIVVDMTIVDLHGARQRGDELEPLHKLMSALREARSY